MPKGILSMGISWGFSQWDFAWGDSARKDFFKLGLYLKGFCPWGFSHLDFSWKLQSIGTFFLGFAWRNSVHQDSVQWYSLDWTFVCWASLSSDFVPWDFVWCYFVCALYDIHDIWTCKPIPWWGSVWAAVAHVLLSGRKGAIQLSAISLWSFLTRLFSCASLVCVAGKVGWERKRERLIDWLIDWTLLHKDKRERERLIDWLIERLIDWLIELYYPCVINKDKERERGGGEYCWVLVY